MGMISVGKENSTSIDLYYEDHGTALLSCSFTGGRSAEPRGRSRPLRCSTPATV